MSEQIVQSKAYDAHYLAVSEQFGIEFWAADERHYNKAPQLGIN